MNEKFTDAYINREDGVISLCYRTDMLSYEEILKDGSLYVGVYNVGGFCPLTCTLPKPYRLNPSDYLFPRAFDLTVNGRNITSGYSFADFKKSYDEIGLHTELVLENRAAELKVILHTRLDGTSVTERWLTVENLSDKEMTFGRISVMGGALFKCLPENDFKFGSMISGQWSKEGDYQTYYIPEGEYVIENVGNTERYRAPFFTCENGEEGVTVLGQLGFSGEFRIRFRRQTRFENRFLSYSVDLSGDYATILTLAPGECFDTPAFHLCMTKNGVDGAVNEMNDHFRNISSSYRKDMTVEKGFGPEMDMSEKMLFRAIDRGLEFGAELFFLDATWYVGDVSKWKMLDENGEWHLMDHLGDWLSDECRYSKSIREIGDYVHSKGMKFGLWVEIERINERSEFYSSDYPPKMKLEDGSYYDAGGGCRHLDLSKKEAADWAYETICGIIEKYSIDFYRIDYNNYPQNGEKRLAEAVDLRYFANLYDVYKRVQKRYPNVIIQNCAGGGSRLDFGMSAICANAQTTDRQTPPETFEVLNGVTMLLPPEMLVHSVVGGGGHIKGSFGFQLNISRFGNPNTGWTVLPEGICSNPQQTEAVKEMLKTYKEIIRPKLKGSRIFHHTPEVSSKNRNSVGIIELAAADKTVSMIGVFTLSKPENPNILINFRGLDESKKYRVLLDDRFLCDTDGFTLANTGMNVYICNAVDSSAVVAYEIK